MADTAKPKPSRESPPDAEREAHDSGIVSPEKNKIVEEHYKEHPEGDPSVRRIRPDRGEIPITERKGGFMTVIPPEKNPERNKENKTKKSA